MSTLKRRVADFVESALDVTIVRNGSVWRVFEQEHLRRFLSDFDVDCVFDVGANEGQYAESLRAIGYRGPIISFEPIPHVAALLRAKAANDANWFVEEVALDENEGAAVFNVTRKSQFSSLKRPSLEATETFVHSTAVVESVPVQTALLKNQLEHYRAKLGFQRPFLKMDTQGNDLAVARGAGTELSVFVGLQSELAIKKLYAESPDIFDALRFYFDAGFELSALVPNNGGHYPVLMEVDCILFNSHAKHRANGYKETSDPT